MLYGRSEYIVVLDVVQVEVVELELQWGAPGLCREGYGPIIGPIKPRPIYSHVTPPIESYHSVSPQ